MGWTWLEGDVEEALVLVDEAHRSRTRALHRNLRKTLPSAAIIGFTGTPILSHDKTETREVFGACIDRYVIQDAELDGATVPILYDWIPRGNLRQGRTPPVQLEAPAAPHPPGGLRDRPRARAPRRAPPRAGLLAGAWSRDAGLESSPARAPREGSRGLLVRRRDGAVGDCRTVAGCHRWPLPWDSAGNGYGV
jgi:hypothetical protein